MASGSRIFKKVASDHSWSFFKVLRTYYQSRIICSILFLVIYSTLQAQDFKLTSINLTVQDGLAGDNVYCAMQDNKGYIWFGTETGISRYNGRTFENFYMSDGLADNEIFRIDQDSQGRIWFSAFNGKLSYYQNGKFHNQTNDSILAKVDLKAYYVNIFEDSKKNIWLVTKWRTTMIGANGLVKSQEALGLSSNVRMTHFMEKNGRIWGGESRSKRAFIFSEENIVIEESEYEEAEFMFGKDVHLSATNPTRINSYINQFSKSQIASDIWISKTHDYSDGYLWACTFRGAIRVDKSSGANDTFLKGKEVAHVMKDREGNYWFTTLGDGVFFVPSLNNWSAETAGGEVIGNTITLFNQDDKIWFGANGAKFGRVGKENLDITSLYLSKGRSRMKKIIQGREKGELLLVAEEALVIRYKNGLFGRIDGSIKTLEKWNDSLYLIGGSAYLMITDAQKLYKSFVRGNKKIDEGSDIGHAGRPFVKQILLTGSVVDMEPYKEGVLVATSLGLYFLDQEFNYRKLEDHPIMNSVINDVKVMNDSTFLVASSGYGTFLWKSNKWTNLSTENGLTSDIHRKVFVENDSSFWIATNNGVNHVQLQTERLSITKAAKVEGLMSDDVNDLLIIGDQLFAATSKGISKVDISGWEAAKPAPLIDMRGMRVQDQTWPEDRSHLPSNAKNISFHFDGLHFQSLNRVSYEYRLLGFDDGWRKTLQNEVSFSKLSPGSYSFQVKAISTFGEESEIVQKTFSILVPFWASWWFVMVTILGASALIIFLVSWVIRKNRHKEKRKYEFQLRIAEAERKALQSQLNPHFIFNSLNSIQNMVLDEEPDSAYQYLAKFSKLIRRVLEFSDRSMVTLGDELETLRLYMDLENLRLSNAFDYEISLEEGMNLLESIPSMIIQPHVENAIWHGIMPLKGARRGRIDISIFDTETGLSLVVEDNGVGRQTEKMQSGDGFGQRIVNELVRKHKGDDSGETEIIDLFEGGIPAGTKVIIQLKSEFSI